MATPKFETRLSVRGFFCLPEIAPFVQLYPTVRVNGRLANFSAEFPLIAMVFRYEPRNILITGGAGFIASHVVELFCNKYPAYKVRAGFLGNLYTLTHLLDRRA